MSKLSASQIRDMKGKQKIVSLTAYDGITARIVDEAGIHLVLVGDSLGMTILGYETTLPVTMAEMLHHTAAVARGVENALVVADMPFMSYHVSDLQTIENAGRFIKEAAADAVKLEGGAVRVGAVKRIVENGIPVLGHIGLTPQSILAIGGYKVQGRKPDEVQRFLDDAASLVDAGVFGIVLECIPKELGKEITAAVSVPTIGIGAGPDCDGQILVLNDVLGFYASNAPKLKFVKHYAELGAAAKQAFERYREEVEQGTFPSDEHSF